MKNEITIRKAAGGYIIAEGPFRKDEQIFTTLDALLEWLLLHYEGRAPSFKGPACGSVTIKRGERV